MLGIEREISIFLQALIAGSVVYLVYCMIRVLRRLICHNLLFVSIEDLLFWIGTGIYLFARIFDTSDGRIRGFFVIGVFWGSFMMHCNVKMVIRTWKTCMKKHQRKVGNSIDKSKKTS